MSYSYPIGASTPLSPLPPQDAAGDADDTTVLGGNDLGDFKPQLHEIDPPYCPVPDNDGRPTPHRAGIVHPSVNGTQVGSEG